MTASRDAQRPPVPDASPSAAAAPAPFRPRVSPFCASLSSKKILELDPERKANMVSNLLVVLCSERGTQPVVNSGSLY